ncbi:MAG: flagellar protein FlgN [Gallionella sp.]
MKQTTASSLLAALNAEQLSLLNFVTLLEREQEMLIANQSDQLHELSDQKTTASLVLNELSEKRRALLQECVPQLDAESVRAWLKMQCAAGAPVWQQIIALAKRSKQLNNTNGELIQMKLRHNQQSLAALFNAAKKANLYGPNGRPAVSPGSGRSLGNG